VSSGTAKTATPHKVSQAFRFRANCRTQCRGRNRKNCWRSEHWQEPVDELLRPPETMSTLGWWNTEKYCDAERQQVEGGGNCDSAESPPDGPPRT